MYNATQIKIIERVEEAYQKAEKHFGRSFDRYRVTFGVRGTTAGYCNYTKEELQFNMILATENGETFLHRTPAHEVAHHITREVYGFYRYGKKIRAHGKEWKFVMEAVMGIHSSRCHSYDVTNARVRKVKRDFKYACGCTTYNLTSIRHNKIQKGFLYSCKKCRKALVKA